MKKIIKSEDDVKAKIIKPTLERWGAWFFMHVPMGRGKAGVPDYVACVPIVVTQEMVGKRIGLFVAPEAKAPKKKHNWSAIQEIQMQEIDLAGGVTGVVSNQFDMDHMHWHISEILKGEQ